MICRNTFSSSFSGEKMSLSLEALRLQPLERTTAVFSMVLGFILAQTHCVHKDTARYVSSYSKPFKLLLKEQTNCPPKSGNFTDNNFNLSK